MDSEIIIALTRHLGVDAIKTEAFLAHSGVWPLTVTVPDSAVKIPQIQSIQSLHLYTKLMHELVNVIYYVVTRSPQCSGKCISLNHIKLLTFDLHRPTKSGNFTRFILILWVRTSPVYIIPLSAFAVFPHVSSVSTFNATTVSLLPLFCISQLITLFFPLVLVPSRLILQIYLNLRITGTKKAGCIVPPRCNQYLPLQVFDPFWDFHYPKRIVSLNTFTAQ